MATEDNKVESYFITCPPFTGLVDVRKRDGIVVRTAPCFSKFKGQPFTNLEKWLEKFEFGQVLRM